MVRQYLIYKITNLINGKYYIGRHITSNINDSYMGSGIEFKRLCEEKNWNHNTLSWIKSLGKKIKRGPLKGFLVEKINVT